MLIVDPVVSTERLDLRPFEERDLVDLVDLQSRDDVARFLYWEARDEQAVRGVLTQRIHQDRLAEEGDVLVLAVERRDTARMIGDVTLWWRSVEHKQGEIGFVFHPDHQGRGYAAEAAAAVLDLGFGALDLHRIFGRTDARNDASAALMRRLGMRQEAHLVQNEIFKGEWGDELVFAILGEEWRAAGSAGQLPGAT